MKFTRMVKQTVEVDAIRISLGGRAFDDPSEDWSGLPLFDAEKGEWTVDVDLATGRIKGWPGGAFDLFTKICDEGIYTLLQGDAEIVAIAGYVPNGVVPGEDGDYVEMKIAADGTITNWPRNPDLSKFTGECSDDE